MTEPGYNFYILTPQKEFILPLCVAILSHLVKDALIIYNGILESSIFMITRLFNFMADKKI